MISCQTPQQGMPPWQTGTHRAGTATVELAVCLPVLVILVFGSIEVANFIHLKQDLTVCAYEAAMVACRPGQTSAQAIARCEEVANAKRIQQIQATVTPTVNAETAAGTEITITVRAAAAANYAMPVRYFRNRELSAVVVIPRL